MPINSLLPGPPIDPLFFFKSSSFWMSRYLLVHMIVFHCAHQHRPHHLMYLKSCEKVKGWFPLSRF